MGEPSGVDPALLQLIRCPRTLLGLRNASAAEIDAINRLIVQGNCFDADAEPVVAEVHGGLTTADGAWFYPVRNHIPTLIPGEAIRLDAIQLESIH